MREEEDALLALEEKENRAKEDAKAYLANFDDRDPEVRKSDLFYRDRYLFSLV